MVHKAMLPYNLAKNKEAVSDRLKGLRQKAGELALAEQKYQDEFARAKNEMHKAEGKELRLKGRFVAAKWRGGYNEFYVNAPELPAAQYRVGAFHKVEVSKDLPLVDVVWLIPTDESDPAEQYGARFDTLEEASLAEIKATHNARHPQA